MRRQGRAVGERGVPGGGPAAGGRRGRRGPLAPAQPQPHANDGVRDEAHLGERVSAAVERRRDGDGDERVEGHLHDDRDGDGHGRRAGGPRRRRLDDVRRLGHLFPQSRVPPAGGARGRQGAAQEAAQAPPFAAGCQRHEVLANLQVQVAPLEAQPQLRALPHLPALHCHPPRHHRGGAPLCGGVPQQGPHSHPLLHPPRDLRLHLPLCTALAAPRLLPLRC
mmetsp:Transcript_7554/g.31949  ORF Transcript_7554/g.31949 Transcript_7554/m.31949 type:complete len:222 (+) Transcript_7554:853-1518(+)